MSYDKKVAGAGFGNAPSLGKKIAPRKTLFFLKLFHKNCFVFGSQKLRNFCAF